MREISLVGIASVGVEGRAACWNGDVKISMAQKRRDIDERLLARSVVANDYYREK